LPDGQIFWNSSFSAPFHSYILQQPLRSLELNFLISSSEKNVLSGKTIPNLFVAISLMRAIDES
jgi:hypothetical protein